MLSSLLEIENGGREEGEGKRREVGGYGGEMERHD
tara:strand:- start:900 stop:1004 length:105 start_codon:yes stop_codon:yes gene_type:complete